ncbi:MAG: tight adherence protein C [Candidatus Aldehydirespiratoraceae bacterium]|jgi:tight adherence protein C
MSAGIAVLCVAGALALMIRPWWARPRMIHAHPRAAVSRPSGIVAAGPLWGALVVAGWMVHPVLSLLILVGPSVRERAELRRVSGASARAIVSTLPEAIDLIGLGVAAGLGPREALLTSHRWLPHPFADVFGEALRRADAGEPLSDAIDVVAPALGHEAQALCVVLSGAELAGGALAADLVRLGDDARRGRRSAAAARAQRLPVQMLAPLVLCVLPAFGLVAVVPLLLTGLADFGL